AIVSHIQSLRHLIGFARIRASRTIERTTSLDRQLDLKEAHRKKRSPPGSTPSAASAPAPTLIGQIGHLSVGNRSGFWTGKTGAWLWRYVNAAVGTSRGLAPVRPPRRQRTRSAAPGVRHPAPAPGTPGR